MRANWKEIPKDEVKGQWAAMYVTLNRKGEIKMSRVTYQRLHEPKAFHVLFDAANNRIGLKPTAAGLRNAFIPRPIGRHGGKVIRVFRLMAEAGIILPETIRFFDADIDLDGILVLDLRTAVIANHGRAALNREAKKRERNAVLFNLSKPADLVDGAVDSCQNRER
jgi:hypothetical protein